MLLLSMLSMAFNIQPAKTGPNSEATLLLVTDKHVYSLGENITITLTNIGSETVMFGGWPFCYICTYPDWEPVFPKDFVYLAWDLEPGESEVITWNQYDVFKNTSVEPGRYVVYEHNYGYTAFFDIASSVHCVADDMNITLTVYQPVAFVGEELDIIISVTNIGSGNVTLKPHYGSNVFDIIAYNGTRSWKWSYGRIWILIYYPPIVLYPGETYVEDKIWNLYIYSDLKFLPPAPGDYALSLFPLQITCFPHHQVPIRMMSPIEKVDVNHDSRIDVRDITIVTMAFGSKPREENWNKIADLNYDRIVDIRDITIVALEFGKTL